MKSFPKDLNWKFSLLTLFIVAVVVITSHSLLMNQARVGMEGRLGEKAAFINSFYSFLIADALQRNDDVTLQQVINRLEEDPEITSVIVVDTDRQVRYNADSEKLGTVWKDPLIEKALETGDGVMSPVSDSGGRALALVAPLKVAGKPHPIGAVRIDLTYRHVAEQLKKFDSSFHLAVIGFISAAVGLMMIFMRTWVGTPMAGLEKTLTGLHLATAEPNLPESPDEFGRLNKALNDMILRFRGEMQEQLGVGPANPLDMERDIAERLMRAFLPQARFFIADKDNRIISKSSEGLPVPGEPTHVLDLITDINFANLVAAAFQKEGELVQGPILFHKQPYVAAVLCIPQSESKAIKTVIALQAQSEKGESSS